MTIAPLLFVIAALVIAGTTVSASEVNQSAIDLVKAGKIDVARASWWGFNSEDSTEALQAAVDSGVKTLIVDNLGKPWIIRPINLVSNQEIIFSSGVEVVAKRGEFKGKGDSLFTASGKKNISLIGYGATLRMHRSDYVGPDYEKAEWRMVLRFLGCSDVRVFGLTLAESGGDGIYLGAGPGGETNKNVHIKDVVCDKNHRQGISVITAENLLIENAVLSNTAGTAPEAGIDLEPNNAKERLVNVVLRNCTTKGNNGNGYLMYLGPLNAGSEPVSIRFENCRSINDNQSGTHVIIGKTKENTVKGLIEFDRCSFEGSGDCGIIVSNNPAGACKVRFDNCSVINPAAGKPDRFPVMFGGPTGGVELADVLIRDTMDRSPIRHTGFPDGVPAGAVSGRIKIDHPAKQEQVTITPEMLMK